MLPFSTLYRPPPVWLSGSPRLGFSSSVVRDSDLPCHLRVLRAQQRGTNPPRSGFSPADGPATPQGRTASAYNTTRVYYFWAPTTLHVWNREGQTGGTLVDVWPGHPQRCRPHVVSAGTDTERRRRAQKPARTAEQIYRPAKPVTVNSRPAQLDAARDDISTMSRKTRQHLRLVLIRRART
jgi:hypothetical protein